MLKNKHAKGFTLIELLIVIAIVAILAAVVILTLNPAQLLAQSRDSNRISDLATLKSAVSLYLADVSDLVTYPIAPNYGTCYAATTSTLAVNCDGWMSQHPNATNASNSRAVDKTGWLPVDFTKISAGSPLGNLPADPVGLTSGVYFYAYAATSSGGYTFEIDANMESTKYACGGGDVEKSDGGDRNTCGASTAATSSLYEVGTAPGLNL